MWINTQTQAVYKTHSEIRSGFPQVSMPSTITDLIIQSLGLEAVTTTPKPDGYIVEEVSPVLVDGVWTQQWATRPPTEAETLAKSSEVRAARDKLLTESDWIVARSYEQGVPVPQEWVAYRQALRDITQQPEFPWEVVWPTL